jgi:hypothetical protein
MRPIVIGQLVEQKGSCRMAKKLLLFKERLCVWRGPLEESNET